MVSLAAGSGFFPFLRGCFRRPFLKHQKHEYIVLLVINNRLFFNILPALKMILPTAF
jgi:hypothetical protein